MKSAMTTLKTASSAGLIATALLFGQAAQADFLLNLTDTTHNTILPDADGSGSFTTGLGTVTFTYDQMQPTGTGVLEPFVRIQQHGEEQGYNTTQSNNGALPFDEVFGIWTHDVAMGDLEVNNGNYEFVLDIGEPVSNANSANGQNSLLSLDGVRLYATNDLPTANENSTLANGANGDWDALADMDDALLLWEMDEAGTDNTVLLDANRDGNPGNGVSDMLMLVPESIIAAGSGYTNFILWSRFGLYEASLTGAQSFGTFEEWAHVTNQDGGGGPPTGVPAPAPLALLGLGIALFARMSRRFQA